MLEITAGRAPCLRRSNDTIATNAGPEPSRPLRADGKSRLTVGEVR